jgi:hypothetical protein
VKPYAAATVLRGRGEMKRLASGHGKPEAGAEELLALIGD